VSRSGRRGGGRGGGKGRKGKGGLNISEEMKGIVIKSPYF
jgi:hypothetical protein